MRGPRAVVDAMVDWFEERGVYVPAEDDQSLSPLRDFGWQIAAWLITVAMFVIFFTLAA
jgi:hypothetical protein